MDGMGDPENGIYSLISFFNFYIWNLSELVSKILSAAMTFNCGNRAIEVIEWQVFFGTEPTIIEAQHIRKAWDMPVFQKQLKSTYSRHSMCSYAFNCSPFHSPNEKVKLLVECTARHQLR